MGCKTECTELILHIFIEIVKYFTYIIGGEFKSLIQ